jgi:hypothetical protein
MTGDSNANQPKKEKWPHTYGGQRKSMMVRCIALKAAGFKAGVAIPTHLGDSDDNFTQLPRL